MGNKPYSPTLSKARLKIELWKGVCKRKNGGKYSSKKIKRLAKKVNLQACMNLSLEGAKEELEKAENNYANVSMNANKLRNTFLRQKATEIAEESKGNEKNVIFVVF